LFLFAILFGCSKTEVENFEIDFDREKMNQLFSTIEEKKLGMGSVSIFKDGKEDYQTTFGCLAGFKSLTIYFLSDDVSISYVGNAVSMTSNDIVIGALSSYSNFSYNLP